MEVRDGRFQFTLRDVLVLFVVVALLLAVLVPLLQDSREEARRAQCVKRLGNLGLAFHNFHDRHKFFPASSGVTLSPDWSIRAIDGWSFLVHLLPYMEYSALYDTLDAAGGKPLVEPSGGAWSGTPHADAADTRIAELWCPSNRNPVHVAGPGPTGWLTNYKAMGATHVESLSVASPTPGVPLYLPESKTVHPDGALYPGTPQKLSAFGRDGMAHTILLAETMDPGYGVWTVGDECTLVGLPSEQPNERYEVERLKIELYRDSYYAPVGFDIKYWGEVQPAVGHLKPYIAYDFDHGDPGPYVGADPRNTYGPSSGHADVVNHLFADGAVRSMSSTLDFPLYMFMITRNGGDPVAHPFSMR